MSTKLTRQLSQFFDIAERRDNRGEIYDCLSRGAKELARTSSVSNQLLGRGSSGGPNMLRSSPEGHAQECLARKCCKLIILTQSQSISFDFSISLRPSPFFPLARLKQPKHAISTTQSVNDTLLVNAFWFNNARSVVGSKRWEANYSLIML